MQRSCPLYCSCRRRKLWQKRSTLGFSTARSNSCRTNRSEEHTSELQSPCNLVCRLLLEKKYVSLDGFQITEVTPDRILVGNSVGARPVRAHPRPKERQADSVPFQHGNVFFFNDTATTEIYTLSLHDALPI